MRVGANPNRQAFVAGYGPIISAVITHLPDESGYHEKRFEVIRCSLEMMRKNPGVNFQTLVWDNGSFPAFTNWLRFEYKPDYLILSPNVGKSIARASLIRMLPPETILNISDDDMYYYPDWFRHQLTVLETYPNVGLVSGYPVRTQFRFGNGATVKWGEKNKCIEYGRFISDHEERDFCRSIGREYEDFHVNYTKDDIDARLTYKGVKVYATGHHCQFVCRAGVVAPHTEYHKAAMLSERPFELNIDRSGLLRLTTCIRLTRHIGNVLDDDLRKLWKGSSF